MKITGDITLGNILTIIAMVGALLVFALRIEARMTRLEVQMEQLIQNETRQYGAKPRKTVHSVDQLFPLSLLSTSALPPCAHGVHTESRPLLTNL